MGIWVLYAYIYRSICYWPWLYIGHGYIVLEHSTHLVWTRRSSHDAADGGRLNFLTETKNSAKKCSWGLKTQILFFSKMFLWFWNPCTHFFFGGGGGGFWGVWGAPRAGSENDTLLPMTMTCDRLKFWSGPAWRSKVIIRKPWRRKNKQN